MNCEKFSNFLETISNNKIKEFEEIQNLNQNYLLVLNKLKTNQKHYHRNILLGNYI